MARAVLYHANCADGFGAAWAAWRKFGDAADYIPVRHGAPPPELRDGSEVYILDFCYRRDVIESMHARFDRLAIVDHHRTAEQELMGLDYAVFDNDRSGAVLAWHYFHPDQDVPALLRYVMDNDLWLFELPDSREVSAALSSYPMEFDVWSRLDVRTLAKEGVPILRYKQEQVAMLAHEARRASIAGHPVLVVNASTFGSEVGASLLKQHPDIDFVAIYFDRSDGIRQWSLRSREDFDVSVIARLYQNGGHRQAAGFETKIPADLVPLPPPPKKATRRK